jgi:endo-1,4-beta-xylanase
MKHLLPLTFVFMLPLLAAFAQPNKSPGKATLAGSAPFPVGAALSPKYLHKDRAYTEAAIREFNSVTAENIMKPRGLSRGRGQYHWAAADSLVAFCRQHNKQLHGHTLVWHESVPLWVKSFSGDSAAWEGILREHIRDVAAHFRGKVRSWDVVNEALSDTAGRMRNTPWRQHLGDDYVARCFRYAREADPDVKLFYNDYSLESDPAKLAAALRLIDDFKRRGIPLDGVGLQMHIAINTPEAGIRKAMREMAGRGLLVHISELDVRINTTKDSLLHETPALLAQQAEKVRQVVRAFLEEVPPAQRFAITTWGVADPNSWVMNWRKQEDYPLLFDHNYKPKPAHTAFIEAVKGK